MTTYNFDKIIERKHTSSVKWGLLQSMFGHADILPMWVADMDFEAPPEAIEAMKERAAHGVFGYTYRSPSYMEAIISWQERRHQWKIKEEWVTGCPGVVTALSMLLELMTEPGDNVMIHVPVYHPFYNIIKSHHRNIVHHQLVRSENGRYEIDFEQMERQIIDEQVKLLVLCHPHNPVGRVWTKEELTTLGDICVKHGVFVLSDEIHADIVYDGHKHIPFASISDELAMQSATCMAPSKTFNIAGLHSSYTVIANEQVREKLRARLQAFALSNENCFAQVAVEACYRYGEPWLEQLLAYLQQNVNTMQQMLYERLPEVSMFRPEGTYLAWFDCRTISSDPEVLKDLMFNQAKVAFNEGSMFGAEGAGFLRVNFGTPRSLLIEGMERFIQAVSKR